MSLQLVAQHLAAHGRGPDDTLVHMTSKEVAGLQALAQNQGGSLTINPHTGLPEAGFLSSILPMLGGLALAATGIGAPAAALLMGGGTAAVTGDLKKGLMAGLGAYGGAGLGESLIGAGAAGILPQAAASSLGAPAAEGVASLATPAAQEIASAAIPEGVASMTPAAATIPQTATEFAGMPYSSAYTGAPATATQAAGMPYNGSYTPELTPENMSVGQRFEALKAGTTGKNLWNYAKENPLPAIGMAYGPLSALNERNMPNVRTVDSDRGPMANAGYQYDPGWTNPTPEPDQYGKEQVYNRPNYYIPKAEGGLAALAHGGETQGQYNLGSYSDGGRLLRGPGDGVSDDIPATIGKNQPARLADGEFVVPARIVSEIGNGSTEAGARKLYAMMDKVQNARKATVGKDKIAKNTRADRYLPA